MASSLTFGASYNLSGSNGSVACSFAKTFSLSLTGTARKDVTVPVTISMAAVDVDSISTGGLVYAENVGANAVVLASGASEAPLVALSAGDFAFFRLAAGATLYAQATGASSDVRFILHAA